MGTPLFYFKISNIQWTKFERKSIVTFISEELPKKAKQEQLNSFNLSL